MSFPDLWRELRNSLPAMERESKGMRLRLAVSVSHARVHAAVQQDGRAACLIELYHPAFGTVRLPPPARRIRITVLAADDVGLPPDHEALLIELRDAEFDDLFARLVADLGVVVQAASGARAAAESVGVVLHRWSRFMDRGQPQLSDAEVKGLIGELCVLERLVARIGPAAALDAWKSPAGAYRDFEAAAFTVEVKAFSPSQGSTVRVNDPIQLEADPGVPLYLFCQELGASDDATNSLAGHAARVALAFADSAETAERFDLLLATAGFPQPMSLPLYELLRWKAGPLHAFNVVTGFPRIRPNDVPAGVIAVRFSLEVAALNDFRVDVGSVVDSPSAGSGGGEGVEANG